MTTSSVHDERLLASTNPPGRANPVPRSRYDVLVLGAGAGGLVAAGLLAATGARVALVEGRALGGDCTNVGCVPSKAVLHAASVVAAARRGGADGWLTGEVAVDGAAVLERMRRIRADIAADDDIARFEGRGVEVFLGRGTFTGPDRLRLDPLHDRDPVVDLRFDRAVLANGSTPLLPPIEGLDAVDALTNETIWDLDAPPASMVVVGGGPIGCELGQAFARFGTDVTLVHGDERVLPKDPAAAGEIVADALRADGITLVLGAHAERVEALAGGRVRVHAGDATHDADALLVATGRAAPPDPGYGALGVDVDDDGFPVVDARMRTSAAHVHALGDVALDTKFTHMAGESAIAAALGVLLPFGGRTVDEALAPWCTYTEPAVGHVGLTEVELDRRGTRYDVHHVDLADVDRAELTDDTAGFVRILTRRGRGGILGATVVSRDAGEVTAQLAIARAGGTGLLGLSSVTYPYPVLAESFRDLGQTALEAKIPLVRPVGRALWHVPRALATIRRRFVGAHAT